MTFKKLLITALTTATLTLSPAHVWAKAYQYTIDPEHSHIGFKVMHIGYAYTIGRFNDFSGSFVFDEETQSLSNLSATIKTRSVDTAHKKRDDHVRNDDFLDTSSYPEMTFILTDTQQINERQGQITGDLTLLGETKSVTLDVVWNKSGPYPFGGSAFSDPPYVLGASATATIKRSDFGMTYGIDNGLVGDEVEIILEIEAIRGEPVTP